MTLLDVAWLNLQQASQALLLPALVFGLLTICAKGFGAFGAVRASACETAVNLAFFVLDAALIAPPLALLVVAMQAGLAWVDFVLVPPRAWDALPFPLVALLTILVGDFVGYWRHRLEHGAALWPSHAIHHSDQEMTWLGLVRMHPINRLSTTLIDNGALLLCGFPPSVLVANALVRHYWGHFVHADLPWTLGPFGHVLVSPVMHRWHHANDKAAHNTNFATVFSIFDRAFGTLRVPGPCRVPLGVGDLVGHDVVSQLAHPFRPGSYGWLRRQTRQRWAALTGAITRPRATAAPGS